ncbi:PepSY-associated TM helix domain-containing protein [Shewanella surugensis]|uniref:PepSY domain-containing protein n=1 Tax=Shewanella surugensis TaxID=212020 RepID=A0ABT0LDN2_9GAMM|nr:PepSY-associated TM helix domain-containing protein [Shewanella surugensis]MCL1125425.1 PepSY domain-containing protein [Shewanella surugensis]
MNRKKLFKWHSWFALTAMLPLMILSITGSILVFKPEIDLWLMKDHVALMQGGGNRLSLDKSLADISQQLPEYELGRWKMFDDSARPDVLFVIKRGTFDWYKVYFNPYQGQVISQAVPLNHDFTDWLLELHAHFLLEQSGQILGLILAGVFFFLGVSGLLIYKNFWKRLFTLRWDKKWRAFFSDIHKMFGVISAPIFIILAITGGYWNVSKLTRVSAGGPPAPLVMNKPFYNPLISFDRLQTDLEQVIPEFSLHYIGFPLNANAPILMRGGVSTPLSMMSEFGSGARFDAVTGQLITQWDVRLQGNVTQLINSFRSLHFGTFAGVPSRIFWFVLGAMPIVLAFTGSFLWWQRRNKNKWQRTTKAMRDILYKA